MMRTQLNVWAIGLALGLAVGGAAAPPVAPVPCAPVEPGVEQGAPDKKEGPQKVVVTSPQVKDVVVTQRYPCQIHSQRHIKVRSLQNGYLEPILIKEGQAVKKGDVLFKILPVLYKARLDAELAEVKLAQLELDNTRKLFDQKVVGQQEVALHEARLVRAQARASLAKAELSFATIRAPFDGLVGRLEQQEGSLVKEGDVLTTLSDNSVVWVYFQITEAGYLEHMARQGKGKDPSRLKLVDSRLELVLADDRPFNQDAGKDVTVESRFNNETGNISLRADLPNPDGLLRQGMTGNVLIHRTLKGVMVIPQRAAFEVLDRWYVFVVGKDDLVHQREIVVQNEVGESFVIRKGLEVTDRIVLEGGRNLRDGDRVESVFRKPEEARPKGFRSK